MTTNDLPEIKQALLRVGGFLIVAFLIYLLGSTEKWYPMILGTPIVLGGFAWIASNGNKSWVLAACLLGTLAGTLWYIFGV